MGTMMIIDILGSMVIGGILTLLLLQLSERTTENTYNKSGDLSLQQNIATIARIVETDFRRIGYCADYNKLLKPSEFILSADTSSITFITDLEGNGTIDQIRYYLGPTSELTATKNPRDRILYRVENNEAPVASNLGVTAFKIIYFNTTGDTIPSPVAVPGAIASLEININCENTEAYDELYASAFWRQIRLVARNLKNR